MDIPFKQSTAIDLQYIMLVMACTFILLVTTYIILKFFQKRSTPNHHSMIHIIEIKKISIKSAIYILKIENQKFIYIESPSHPIFHAMEKIAEEHPHV